MGDMPWGEHVCVFYLTKEDLLDTLVPYFKAGLDGNEFSMWAVSEPLEETEAIEALRQGIPRFDRHLERGSIELIRGHEWYLKDDQFDMQRIIGGWHAKLNSALARGYDGMRASGSAFWLESNHWKEFCEYEQELNKALANRPMVLLCTYPIDASRAVDVLDIARAHQFTVARRNRRWEFMETQELVQAREIRSLNDALTVLIKPFTGSELLMSDGWTWHHLPPSKLMPAKRRMEQGMRIGFSPASRASTLRSSS
jgi:MEDS: MEthanogen/methylotroph, DcmR Sensory domain